MTIRSTIFKLKPVFLPIKENNFRPKFLESRFLLWCLIVLFVLKLVTLPLLVFFPKTVFFSDISRVILMEFLNQERIKHGLQPLTENDVLNKAALLKARDMLEKDYFSHHSPEGISPWYWFRLAGYNYWTAGENLAIGFLDSEEVHYAWLNSPSHRANLLNPVYQEVGIAVLSGDFQGNRTTLVVQLFGSPAKEIYPKTLIIPEIKTKKVPAQKTEEFIPKTEKKEELIKKETTTEEIAMEETIKKETGVGKTEPRGFVSPKKEVLSSLNKVKDKTVFNFLYFFYSDYYKILQLLIYGFLILIILALVVNIVVRIDIQHPDLIFKTLGFIAILVLFIFIDKNSIIKLIPHNFNIY